MVWVSRLTCQRALQSRYEALCVNTQQRTDPFSQCIVQFSCEFMEQGDIDVQPEQRLSCPTTVVVASD